MAFSVTPLSTGDPTLASRYLADQLPDDERIAFEQRMLEDPALLREVEATVRFKAGLAIARDSGRLELAPRPHAWRPSHMAVAAMFALFAVGVLLWRSPQDAAPVPWVAASLQQLASARGDTLPATGEYVLLRRRSGEPDMAIDLPAERGAIALRVLPDVSEPQSLHRVTLTRTSPDGAADQPSASASSQLRAGPGGYVTLFIDSASLQAGLYRLDVAPVAGTSARESFFIRFQAEGARP